MSSDYEIIDLIKSAAQEGQFDKMSLEDLESIYQKGCSLIKAVPNDEVFIKAVNQFKKEIRKRKVRQFLRWEFSFVGSFLMKLWNIIILLLGFACLGYFSVFLIPFFASFQTPVQRVIFACSVFTIFIIILGLWLKIKYSKKHPEITSVKKSKIYISDNLKIILVILANIPPLLTMLAWPFFVFCFLLGIADSGLSGISSIDYMFFLWLYLLFYPLLIFWGISIIFKAFRTGKSSRSIPGFVLTYGSLLLFSIIFGLVTGTDNIVLKAWYAITMNHKGPHIVHLMKEKSSKEYIRAVAWSPDGKSIATAGESKQITIWDASTMSIRHQLKQDWSSSAVDNITFSPDSRYVASGLRIVNVWKVTDGTLQATLVAPHVIPDMPQGIVIESLHFSPNGKILVVTYCHDKEIMIAYRTDNWQIAWSYVPQKYTYFQTPLVFTPDDNNVIIGVGEVGSNLRFLPKILILNMASGKYLRSIDKIHIDKPTALAISSDGKWVATGTETGSKTNGIENKDPVRLWNIETGKLIKELPVKCAVKSLAFSRNGKFLFGAKCDTHMARLTLAVWDIESGELVQEVRNSYLPNSLAVSPDGKKLAAACGYKLSIYEITTGN